MECKNCNYSIRTDFSYCSRCGAKVVRKRITFKNLWYDITERYFNLDNTFLKTFLHLFTKPEVVIIGYISGIRKKYLNPISYLAIALTLSGVMIFFMKRAFPDGMDFDIFKTGVYTAETSKKLTNFMFTFYSFLFLLYIPVFAGSSWIVFNSRKLNFTEYIISFIYSMAHYSLLIFIPTIIILMTLPDSYMNFSMISLLLMVIYSLYVLKKISGTSGKDFTLKAFTFLMLFGVGFMLIAIIQFILMFATGVMTLQDFMPK